ncbi:hypothetical protein ACVWZ6_001676 [Bradyrhizobium sp. GM6.1]
MSFVLILAISVPDLSFLFCRGRLGAVLLPSSGDVALDPASNERAKIGLRAIARIGRCFIRVRPEIGFDGIEQGCELRLMLGELVSAPR